MTLKIPVTDLFAISDDGTVLTGTVLEGQINIGQRVTIELPTHELQTRVDGLEVDRKIVSMALKGESVGMLFRALTADDLSGGLRRTEQGIHEVIDIVISGAESPWWKFWE